MDINIGSNQFIILFTALGGAFFIGLNHVLIRKALDSGTRTQAVLISLATSTVIFWALLPIFGRMHLLLDPKAGLFIIAGLLGPGLGRTLNIISLKKIGVARTAPIVGIAPLFAAVLAIVFLGERLSIFTVASIVLIFIGIYVLTQRNGGRFWHFDAREKRNLFTPLSAAFFGGSYLVFIKWILSGVPDPFVGAAITTTAAFFALFVFAVVTKRIQNIRSSSHAIKFSVLGGLAMAAGFLLNFKALEMGSVSLVAPLLSTFPLFSVLLSFILLRESITKHVLIGAVIIVGGVIIINF